MSSLLPSLPTAPVIRHFSELHSDPCCDKAEQVKREIETLIDLNLPEHLFMQLSGLGYMRQLKSPGGRTELRGHSRHIRVCHCLLSSSRAVFLALAEVNHSTLTIFALPLYKRQGTRPTDPITSLSGNKCLTIQPYWVWKINPFHSRALPISSESSKADVTMIIIARHQISQQRVSKNLLCISKAFFVFISLFFFLPFCYCQFILLFHISYFCWWYVCVVWVSQIIYVLPLHRKM